MKKSDIYVGPLEPAAAADGMNAARENAKRLAQDARLLLEADRFASSAALAVLSIEESGKPSILRELVVARDERELRDAWKQYRSHKAKNVGWILPQLVTQGARVLDDFRAIFAADADHAQLLDDIKQLAFYTDCLALGTWSRPDFVINRELAASLVSTAELFAEARPVSTRELELWREHVGPVWKGPLEWMKTAVIKWDAAMQAEGLADSQRRITMEDFLRGDQAQSRET